MFELPIELQCYCVQFIDPESLKSLRFVNRATLPIATEALFRTVVVQFSNESVAKFTHILGSPKLNLLVRRVIFNTDEDPDPYPHLYRDSPPNEEKEPLESFLNALCDVGKFSNLKEVELKFTRECAAPESTPFSYSMEVAETVSFRTDVLEAFLEGLNQSEKPALGVDSLTIKNLQDWTIDEIYESDSFQVMRSRLKKLALQITTENASQGSVDLDGCHRGFTDDLPGHWLRPLQPKLTHLTLYSANCYWGIYPFCDLRGIFFPNLKSLVLGNFTIAHDWQVGWILSHGSTLEELVLDNCPIITVLQMEEEHKLVNFPLLVPLPQAGLLRPRYLKHVDLRWYHVLPRFQSGLPKLGHFAMGKGNWGEQEMFEERYELVPEILNTRYCMFRCGIEPSPWCEGEKSKAKKMFFVGGFGSEATVVEFPDCLVEDVDALCNLLEEVGGDRVPD